MFTLAPQETPHFVYGLALEYYYRDRAIILKAMGRGFGATQSQLENCLVNLGGVVTFNDLKNCITLHVLSLTTVQLRSGFEHTVHRLEIFQVNECGHLEHLSLHRPGHD
ncbi:hypothetical protein TNIN_307161 [Trichonephila inaurata madagascariensis]|uniref:Uncharacterized protein n=1 Tax=Trichonephila inaurata madagascariensis TaxID=2747483 RepID=A0A8X6JSD0_9ARAC|nr:hypothetical protein TNIN_307161 [Trichonephila inaurata madagascariensis]